MSQSLEDRCSLEITKYFCSFTTAQRLAQDLEIEMAEVAALDAADVKFMKDDDGYLEGWLKLNGSVKRLSNLVAEDLQWNLNGRRSGKLFSESEIHSAWASEKIRRMRVG